MNRHKLEIFYSMLKAVKEPRLKTYVMYSANLSYCSLDSYLEFLINRGLIERFNENPRTKYMITNQGKRFLELYREIENILCT